MPTSDKNRLDTSRAWFAQNKPHAKQCCACCHPFNAHSPQTLVKGRKANATNNDDNKMSQFFISCLLFFVFLRSTLVVDIPLTPSFQTKPQHTSQIVKNPRCLEQPFSGCVCALESNRTEQQSAKAGTRKLSTLVTCVVPLNDPNQHARSRREKL